VSQRDPFQGYRLRQLVLQLENFTVTELSTIAGVDRDSIEQFIFKLNKDVPGVFQSKRLPASGVGKPPSRYSLTEEGARLLATRNLTEGRRLRNLLSEKAVPAVVSAPAVAIADIQVPELNVGTWIKSFKPSFTEALKEGALLIVRPSEPISAQIGRVVTPLAEGITLSITEILQALKSILTPWQQMRLEKQGWTAGSYALAGQTPVHLQVEMEGGKPAIKLTQLSTHIPTPDDLRLPNLAETLSSKGHGLVLVTGIARSGRSTAMAALVNSINIKQQTHIATIEEPVHYFYPPGQSFLEQKQVAVDVPNFESALKLVLGNGADVIVLSDFNDPQTFSAALEASERNLIFGRVFAASPGEAVGDIVGMFPGPEQVRVRERLAQNLTGIISLKALPEKSGGTVIAAEVLEWRSELQNLIVEPEQTPQISEAVVKRNAGTSFQQSVEKLYEDKVISADTMARFAASKSA
jgi:twitching motility protein PilT